MNEQANVQGLSQSDSPTNSARRSAIFHSLSDLAKEVAITRNPRPDAPPPYHGDEIIFDLDGKSRLGAIIRDNKMIVDMGSTDPAHRGKGYALAVLERAIKYAADNDLHFQSQDSGHPERAGVYKALARRGYPMKVNFPSAPLEGVIEIDTRGIGLQTTDGLDGPEWTMITTGAPWSAFRR